ncbi:MAG: flagellar basal body rod protein FlgB [Clostridiales bacterium]|nr:flagellar basal body rod protein FlgB [Clostridiales bacterium]
MSLWSSNSMLLTEKSIDYLWKKQEVTANNLANNETPNFKSSYVTFEEEMRQQIGNRRNQNAKDIKRKILGVNPRIHTNYNETNRLDGNNVDIIAENAEMAKSGIQYQYAARAISDDFARLRTAIRGS